LEGFWKEEIMKTTTKIIIRTAMGLALLLAGFAAGFPVGQSIGFSTGSEWAIVQADIVAREAGLTMPINYEEGQFRVVIKQPRNLYKQAWHLADRHEAAMSYAERGERPLSQTASLARNTYLVE
jgi:hypothetical protein